VLELQTARREVMILISASFGNYDKIVRKLPVYAIAYNHGGNPILPPRYRAKALKCAPQLVLGGSCNRDVVWVDGSMEWTGEDLEDLVEQVPLGGVGAFKHRFRNDIYEEADASERLPKYLSEPIRAQVEHYREQGYPSGLGLWECGLLVWRGAQSTIGVQWLAEQLAWTDQDQISFPISAARAYQEITTLDGGNVVDNKWFKYGGHRDENNH
jgi:hypothetical protein